MSILFAVSLLFAVLTCFLLLRTLQCLRRRRILRATSACLGSLMSGTVAAISVILILSYTSYARLIDEQVVSQIEFNRVSPDEYRVRLMIAGESDRLLTLLGDEWQMDAKIVTWKPPLTILGLDPIFQLDRLSGRYSEVDREISEPRSVHSLSAETSTDIWQLARQLPLPMPGVDAHYGTATYLPMADGARYEVSLSRDALLARPTNDQAREALGAWSEQ